MGALVACLGWALGGGLARRDATAAVGLTGLFVGVIGLCHSVLVPTLARGWLRIDLHRIGMRTFGDEKQAAAYADAFTPLFDSPAFRRRLASRGEELVTREVWHWKKPYEMLADHLIAEGRARLSPDDANAMFDVRRALADVSWPVCTAQFTDRGDVGLETLGMGSAV